MYSFMAVLSGMVLASMVAINGELSGLHGTFISALIVRAVGAAFALVACICTGKRLSFRGAGSKWPYLAGTVGAATTVLQNMAFGKISMTSILALGLLGQMLASMLFDCFRPMEKRPARERFPLIPLGFALPGLLIMLDASALASGVAIICSLGAGIAVVVSRILNAQLANRAGALKGSFINQLAGIPVLLPALWIAGEGLAPGGFDLGRPWIYLGGILGVASVLMTNISVSHETAFRVTAFTFTGQALMGVCIDLMLKQQSFDASFWGGMLISLGIFVDMLAEQYQKRKNGTVRR